MPNPVLTKAIDRLAQREDLTVDEADAVLAAARERVAAGGGRLDVGHDLDALADERTVRGQFVRDVRADPSLDEDTRTRVLLAGLRALDGRTPEPAVGQT